ncbi:MAG: hypothetical protein IKQ17_00210 [Kiritimatiellae bacterium]|nr:hypothetical protein [Kiritimatiellia bacterium]
MKNALAIKVNDRSKLLRFGETVTTGSRYAVAVEGGESACGHDAALIVSTPEGLQVAVAELVDGVGELNLGCDAVLKIERKVPQGTVLCLNAVLRCFDEGDEQNVGVGQLQAVAAWQGRENPDTGTVILYKGPKGDDGASPTGMTFFGKDADGNSIYVLSFSDGKTFNVVVPKGDKGDNALMTYAKELDADVYHLVRVTCESTGEFVIAIDKEGVTADRTFDAATIEANQFMKQAGWYCNGKFRKDDPGVLVEKGAKQYAEDAAADATRAETAKAGAETAQGLAETAQGLAETAKGLAETARNEAVQAKGLAETAQGKAETAQGKAETAQAGAETAKGLAETAQGKAETAQERAESARDQAVQAGTAAVAAITTARDAAVDAVETKQTESVGAVGAAETTAVNAVAARQTEGEEALEMKTQEGLDALAALEDAVHKTGDETIEGVKTFADAPVMRSGLYARGVAFKHGSFTLTNEIYNKTAATATQERPHAEVVDGLLPGGRVMVQLVISTTSIGATPTVYVGPPGATGVINNNWTRGTVTLYKAYFGVLMLTADETGTVAFSAGLSAVAASGKEPLVEYMVVPMYDPPAPEEPEVEETPEQEG